MVLCVSVTTHPSPLPVSVITLRHCDHSQCLDPLSGWPLITHPLSLSRSPDALLRRLDSLALSCVSLILGHARALRTRVRIALSLVGGQRSLSVSGQRLVSRQRPLSSALSLSLSHLVARLSLDVPLVPSLSPFLSRLLSIAGQPAFNYKD